MKKVMLIVALLGLVTLGVVAADTATPVPIYPAYDLNQDGVVGLTDLVMLANAYGSHPGDANWNPACDMNVWTDADEVIHIGDGVVSLADLVTLAMHYGEKCPIIGYK